MAKAFTERDTQKFREEVIFEKGFGVIEDSPWNVGSGTGSSASTSSSTLIAWNGISLPDPNYGITLSGGEDVAFLIRQSNGAIVGGDLTGNNRGSDSIDIQTNRFGNLTKVASGDGSIAVGTFAEATNGSTIAIGSACSATAGSSNAIGRVCITSGLQSSAFGYRCQTSASGSLAIGNRSISYNFGQTSIATQAGRAVDGDSQMSILQFTSTTSNNTQTEMSLSRFATIRAVLPANRCWFATIDIAAVQSNYSRAYAWKIRCLIKRDGSNNTSISGVNIVEELGDSVPWTVLVDADDTNESLRIRVTGESATTIHWSSTAIIKEVG